MKSSRRWWLAVVPFLCACSAIVGVNDLPGLTDGGTMDATVPNDSSFTPDDATADSAIDAGVDASSTPDSASDGADVEADASGQEDADAMAAFDSAPATCGDCTAAGGTCMAMGADMFTSCVFNCTGGNNACPAKVVCPRGVPCNVTCDPTHCAQGIYCVTASECTIDCKDKACNAPVVCDGDAGSTYQCEGTSCTEGVEAGANCKKH